ncbi:MAG: SDR family NAD(P)-dependent oxidoreductase [Myxococcota bacterium]
MTPPTSSASGPVLLTGGTRGIGRATAQRLATQGYELIIASRDARAGDAVRRELVAAGGRASHYPCDLGDARQVDALVDHVLQRHGPPYGVVCNAAVTADALTSQLDLDQITSTFRVNLFSTMQMVARLGRPMSRARRGRLVFMSSISSQLGNRGNAVYSATKGALESFMRSVVDELSRRSITINCVLPGFIDTGLTAGYENLRDRIETRIPARRLGTPEDVAAVVSFLLSPQAAYVNGVCLRVDGGVSASLGLR